MSYANLNYKPMIDWREYIKYEKLRKIGCSREQISESINSKKCSMYEQIFLNYVYGK